MALKQLVNLFPEVVHGPVRTIVDEPGWLYAQTCDTWWKGWEHLDPVSILLVYRSPLVTDTGKMYRPVSNLILAANRFEVYGRGSREDLNWMGERGEFLVAKMTQADAFPVDPRTVTVEEVRSRIMTAVGDLLNKTMAVA
ncbi:hypothetical protein KIY83_gp73 [Mycobacterium phage Fameo]|uniref:Uncharacterized protein n=2 Tax=Turbidovirus TaxID=2948936 RepID=A0A220NSG5_9CAUD|nr:hypothetical protein KIY83_gp73 [Mycobacterium phage Fameo]YP_010063975.1 hypothetical protein KIY85_gp72 [Mycobacterium phage Heffalump]ASJ79759.1 hypothetical protein SEA_HEFFALUMP_72 [Mycobacterium phage Heffalump]AVR76842.1 hypothetical protein SEA_FAMEO_73 [Mycobacterium phage Fameo]QGJ89021.1 hypothetical protein SEA_QUEENB2_72 [Mycobacterium phage QueenB2]